MIPRFRPPWPTRKNQPPPQGTPPSSLPNPRARSWEPRDPQAGELRQASCQHAVVADGHPPQHGHPGDRILRVFASSREQIPAACTMESTLGKPCFLNHAKTPRREECRQGPNSGGAAWGENRALKNSLREDQGPSSRIDRRARTKAWFQAWSSNSVVARAKVRAVLSLGSFNDRPDNPQISA
jgi:hypothetical protein